MLGVVPEVPYTILILLNFFFFFIFQWGDFHCLVFLIAYPFSVSYNLLLIPSSVIFISMVLLFSSNRLFFTILISLLKGSLSLSTSLQSFISIFMSITLNSLSSIFCFVQFIFWGFILFFYWMYSFVFFILTVCFYVLSRSTTSPGL